MVLLLDFNEHYKCTVTLNLIYDFIQSHETTMCQ